MTEEDEIHSFSVSISNNLDPFTAMPGIKTMTIEINGEIKGFQMIDGKWIEDY